MYHLQYPIGEYQEKKNLNQEEINRLINKLGEAPAQLKEAVAGLDEEQLDTPYRPNGWTVRQVVHHLPDSHMNGYIRFKLALTENEPRIKPYIEGAWSELSDYQLPIDVSLKLFESLHLRWCALLKGMEPQQYASNFIHPETEQTITLASALDLYVWHSQHHIAHITNLRKRMGW
jgi:uncharacterized damage-inducible protein DinB